MPGRVLTDGGAAGGQNVHFSASTDVLRFHGIGLSACAEANGAPDSEDHLRPPAMKGGRVPGMSGCCVTWCPIAGVRELPAGAPLRWRSSG